ncbi:BTB/POZ protein [Rhizophagus irregularis DAOM 181602=DAOM 197198]|nr:BTB/POZ protein [Rhizophagus irregularis DAOM 181602=DAOM 197198]
MTPDELLNDFEKLLSSGNNYDVIIKAGKNENIRSFYTHSLILSSRSTYFKAALSKNWARKKYGIVVFNKPNINPKIMELILKYIYTGTIELDKQKGLDILKYLVASDEICFGNLQNYIESYIIEKQEKFLNEDPTEVLQTILHYESLTSIKNFYLQLICDNPEVLFESSTFLTIDKTILISIVKRDDLYMNEYNIWEYILEWGIAQMSKCININVYSNWTEEDFVELGEILYDFILLIRWAQIPPKLFHQKISPFKRIFSENIYDDIIGYYLDPDSPPKSLFVSQPRNPSFKIINKKHFAIITSWIDKEKEYYNIKNVPYSLELLYSATRDGFETTKFHELCDDKGPTLIVAKVKDTGRLIGGYNIKNHAMLGDSFIFSFKNQDDLSSPIIARCDDYDSIFTDYPSFINLFNLTIKDPGKESFINVDLMEDYEVFKITKLNKSVNREKIVKSKIDSMIIDKIYSFA